MSEPLNLQIDSDTQNELLCAAARGAGFLSGVMSFLSEPQKASAERIADDIRAAMQAAINAQKVVLS